MNNKNIYNDFSFFKDNVLKHVISELYQYLNDHFKSGNIIIMGSIMHNALGVMNKNHYKDIDISINNNEKGDNIIKQLAHSLNRIDLNYYRDIFNQKFKNKIELNGNKIEFNSVIFIEIFRNEHPISNIDIQSNLNLFDNIYTKFFGYEWTLKCIYRGFIDNLTKGKIAEKHIDKYKNILNAYIKHIDYNQIKNKKMIDDIIKSIETNEIKEID